MVSRRIWGYRAANRLIYTGYLSFCSCSSFIHLVLSPVNDWKYRYMQAVWHGEMQLITDLDRVFEQGEDKNIDVVKREVRQYEKEIKKRGAAVVNQERTKAEKEKTQKTKAKKK